MPREPVRARARDLAALLEVPGGPDPNRLAEQADGRARRERSPRRAREVEHARAEHEPERHAAPRETLQDGRRHAASRRSMAVADVGDADLARCRDARRGGSGAGDGTRTRVARERHVLGTPRAVAHGTRRAVEPDDRACRPRRRGAAGPVSPDTMSRAPRASASTSPIRVGGASRAAPADASTTCARQIAAPAAPRARSTASRGRSCSHAAISPNARRRPALVRPGGAGVEERVRVRR